MRRYPQRLINVAVRDREALSERRERSGTPSHASERALGEEGRVLVRPSGTEPLVRVMVEAETEATASEHAETIAGAVRGSLGAA